MRVVNHITESFDFIREHELTLKKIVVLEESRKSGVKVFCFSKTRRISCF